MNLENSETEYLRVTPEWPRWGEGRGKGKLAWLEQRRSGSTWKVRYLL